MDLPVNLGLAVKLAVNLAVRQPGVNRPCVPMDPWETLGNSRGDPWGVPHPTACMEPEILKFA
jgi:hypothetical protein